MAVLFDAKSTGQGSAVSGVSWTHTPVGTPTAVAIGAYGFAGSGGWTCTYGGTTAPAAFVELFNGVEVGDIFGLASPLAGAQTVAVTTPAGSYPTCVAMTVTGSDPTTCFDAALANRYVSPDTALTVTVNGGAANDLVFCYGGVNNSNADMTDGGGGSNTNDLYLNIVNGGERASASTAPGAASVTATYTASVNTHWYMMAASFLAGAAPTGPTLFEFMMIGCDGFA